MFLATRTPPRRLSCHSELYCKPLAVFIFIGIFGILALLHLTALLPAKKNTTVYLGKMLLLMYQLRRRKTTMESSLATYEFDQRLRELH